MSEVPRMKDAEILREPGQRAEFHLGVISSDREPETVFQGRIRLRLLFDMEQAVELLRVVVEAMQQPYTPSNEVMQIDLESGVLDLYKNTREPDEIDPPGRTGAVMQPTKETKESRRRRGKVAHLRAAMPHAHLTLCGVDADSSRVTAVGREVFENAAAAGLACKNCVRRHEAEGRELAAQMGEELVR